MRKRRGSWLTFTWCVCIIFAGGAASLACLSHPDTHVGAHPLLCIDPSNPVVQGDSSSILLAEGRKLRSPYKILTAVVHPTALGTCIASILDVPAYELCWSQEGIPSLTPVSFQPVLRL